MRRLDGAIGAAWFSDDEPATYRYLAMYPIAPGAASRTCVFVMLNPSTADHDQFDPTLRRCRAFAIREGCNVMKIVNIYALRSTDPAALWTAADPIGPENDAMIEAVCEVADLVVCGWGAHGERNGRGDSVRFDLLRAGVKLHRLGRLTKGGEPRHPLYLPKNAPLTRWA